MSDELDETLPSAPDAKHPEPHVEIYKGTTEFEAFTTAIYATSQPVAILGFDIDRVRALIKANVADVFIGKMAVLAGYDGSQPLGYAISVTQADEIKTCDAIYVAYRPNPNLTTPAYVTVFVERSVVKNT